MRIVRIFMALLLVAAVAACTPNPSPVPPTSSTPTTTPTTTQTPPPDTSSTPTPEPTVAPPTTAPLPPPPVKPAACVAPAGMSKLIDQDKTDSQKPWKLAVGADHVEIWFSAPVAKGFNAEWLGYANQGAAVWNKSPCLDVHVTQGPCPAGKNCVSMIVNNGGGDDGNFDAIEKGGYTTGGQIQLLGSLGNKPDGGERRNVTAHEMGHAVGLVHRNAKVLMNGDTYANVFDADPDEYRNLLFDYGKQRQ